MKMKKKISLSLTKGIVFVFLWMISLTMFAQELTVRGSVKDTKGEPLIGVTVRVKGTTVGTITDIKGIFTLSNVPREAMLEISYVNEITRHTREWQDSYRCGMEEEAEMLEEVVVVGFTHRKSEFNRCGQYSKFKRLSQPVVNVTSFARISSGFKYFVIQWEFGGEAQCKY